MRECQQWTGECEDFAGSRRFSGEYEITYIMVLCCAGLGVSFGKAIEGIKVCFLDCGKVIACIAFTLAEAF